MQIRGGIWDANKSAFIHEYGHSEERGRIENEALFNRELAENNSYSFLPGGSDLLVNYIEAIDRTIVRMRTISPLEEYSTNP